MKEKTPKSLAAHGVLASGIVLWGWALCWSQAALDGMGKPAFAQRCNSQSDHKSSKLKMWYKGEKKCSDKWEKKNGGLCGRENMAIAAHVEKTYISYDLV